jgi:hypothetical protein
MVNPRRGSGTDPIWRMRSQLLDTQGWEGRGQGREGDGGGGEVEGGKGRRGEKRDNKYTEELQLKGKPHEQHQRVRRHTHCGRAFEVEKGSRCSSHMSECVVPLVESRVERIGRGGGGGHGESRGQCVRAWGGGGEEVCRVTQEGGIPSYLLGRPGTFTSE